MKSDIGSYEYEKKRTTVSFARTTTTNMASGGVTLRVYMWMGLAPAIFTTLVNEHSMLR